jgi:hypothetical protein
VLDAGVDAHPVALGEGAGLEPFGHDTVVLDPVVAERPADCPDARLGERALDAEAQC